jgi:predicted nucleotidyltransferase
VAPKRTASVIKPSLIRFAERLQSETGAEHVLLFGSQARGDARPDSDYDVIVVARSFWGVPELLRPVRLYRLFREAGNHAPLDLFCLTPDEFEWASTHITLVNAVLPEAIELLPERTGSGS